MRESLAKTCDLLSIRVRSVGFNNPGVIVCVQICSLLCIHVDVCVFICVHKYVCACARARVSVFVCVCVCVCMHMYAIIYVHIYVYICAHVIEHARHG